MSSTQTARHDPEPKGTADRHIYVCVWVLSERLQCLYIFSIHTVPQPFRCSDPDILKGLFPLTRPPSHHRRRRHPFDLLLCLLLGILADPPPPTNQAGVSPSRQVQRSNNAESHVFYEGGGGTPGALMLWK